MPYEFRKVDILIFDYHPAIGALESADQVQPDVRFLVDPVEYVARHKSGEETRKQHFRIRPMPWRTLRHNHFWKYYQTSGASSANPDFWTLQMPFVCYPLQSQIGLDPDNPKLDGRARAFVFLSGIGWSTNLEIRLFAKEKMKPAQLRDFVAKLLVGAPVFKINGEKKSLKDTFVIFGDRVTQDIYTPRLVAPPKIKRHLVISLSEFEGNISYYRSKGLGMAQMPASDRAMMHSILQGRIISVPDVIKLEKEEGQKFTRTEYLGADFALTYPDHGTLIFLQRSGLRGSALWNRKRRRRKNTTGKNSKKWRNNTMKCHAANVRSYSLMTLALRRFLADTVKHAGKGTKIDLLRNSVEMDLTNMPSRYDNPLSEVFGKKSQIAQRAG